MFQFNNVALPDVKQILDQHEQTHAVAPDSQSDLEPLESALQGYFTSRESVTAVLGVDIYGYSRFPAHRQRLVPIVFRMLYDACVKDVLERESLLFKPEDELTRYFVPTGDGGFQILPTPLHAVAFAVYFEAYLQWFNSFRGHRALREFIGPLTVRWAMTFDTLFRFDHNFFGSAIISNARMMSSDRLNRCLASEDVIDWFRRRSGNLESIIGLDVANIHDVLKIPRHGPSGSSLLFQHPQGIRMIIVQKIGTTEAKGTPLDVHNVFIQARVRHPEAATDSDDRNIVISLGNTNAAGLVP